MDTVQLRSVEVPDRVRRRCVYCLSNGRLRKEQILLRGRDLFLCAPRGQIVEGYLVIAPLSCTGSVSAFPANWFPELTLIKSVVSAFYREAYGVTEGTLYEQGRAGGGAQIDETGGFPHHAHLCCLPRVVDLHTFLSQQYLWKNLAGLEDLSLVVPDSPYVYVEGPNGKGQPARCVYVPATDKGRFELERIRLKPCIAALMGLPNNGNWRTYPGDRELETLIGRFSTFIESSQCKERIHGISG
jgi:hypothetical protein